MPTARSVVWVCLGAGGVIRHLIGSCRPLHLSSSCLVRAASFALTCWSISASLHASRELPLLKRWLSISTAPSSLSRSSRTCCRHVFCSSSPLHALPERHQVLPHRLWHLDQSIHHSLARCLLPGAVTFGGSLL